MSLELGWQFHFQSVVATPTCQLGTQRDTSFLKSGHIQKSTMSLDPTEDWLAAWPCGSHKGSRNGLTMCLAGFFPNTKGQTGIAGTGVHRSHICSLPCTLCSLYCLLISSLQYVNVFMQGKRKSCMWDVTSFSFLTGRSYLLSNAYAISPHINTHFALCVLRHKMLVLQLLSYP